MRYQQRAAAMIRALLYPESERRSAAALSVRLILLAISLLCFGSGEVAPGVSMLSAGVFLIVCFVWVKIRCGMPLKGWK